RVSGQDLERFFYDWTERAGNPTVDVRTEYLSESQQAKLIVKQTQAGETYHFPLTVVLRCPGTAKPITLKQEITEKEQTILASVPARPELVIVDPRIEILSEIQEEKARDLWVKQLHEGPTVTTRIRAVRHFAKNHSEEDLPELARALTEEKWRG